MTSKLYLYPTVENSINHSLTKLDTLKLKNRYSLVTYLLPTARVIQDYRRRLGNRINVQFSQFYGLGQDILDASGSQIFEISDTSVRRLVRLVLREMLLEEQITSFTGVLDKPGFTNVLISWLREMKSQGITPEDYQAYAVESGKERDRQLAIFYQRYQEYLQKHKLADPDGVLWLACEALEKDRELLHDQGSLVVIGFDQFSPVQLELLTHLHTRYDQFAIYLSWDRNRSEDSLALTRLARTKSLLMDNLSLEIQYLEAEPSSPAPTLSFLSQSIFETGRPGEAPQLQDDLRLTEAPSREQEVRTALSQIKKLLIGGVSPVEIMLLAPNPSSYLEIVRTVSEEYSTPIIYDQYIAQNPAIIALLNLLSLIPDYPWRETLEALRSAYINQPWLSPEQINTLDICSRERPVISGREQWQFALKPVNKAIDKDLADIDEEFEPITRLDDENANILADIQAGLMAFFDLITPPETGTVREYTWWLQNKILGVYPEPEDGDEEELPSESETSLNFLEACQNSQYRERDIQAISEFAGVLLRMLRASETITADQQSIIDWDQFFSDLTSLTQRQLLPEDQLSEGVFFGPLEEIRARSTGYLFILGMSEGEFPSQPPADVFYASTEREGHPLPLLRYVPADDATLWWQVISSCEKRLTLLRPYLDENGAEWMPSPYWDEIQQQIPELVAERIPIAPKPTIENSASMSELLIALAVNGAQQVPKDVQQLWDIARFSQSVANLRESKLPPGGFEGFILSKDLLNEFDHRYGQDHVWSPSRLNSYGNCPYGYFAQNVLKLEAQPDPQEGMDVLQFGLLLHEILEKFYSRLASDGVSLASATCEKALQMLEEVSDQILSTAPIKYGFKPGVLWRYEREDIQRMLNSLVQWECEQNASDPRFAPYLQEVKFGLGEDTLPKLHIQDGEVDIQVHGVIDRVDRDANGNLRIIDYKSGRTPFSKKDIEKGLSLQTAIYALAAEQHLSSDNGVIDSFYLHIPSRERSGHLKFSGGVIENETVQAAVENANSAINHIQKGEFPAIPAKPMGGSTTCRSRCDFASLCRVTRESIIKARRRGF